MSSLDGHGVSSDWTIGVGLDMVLTEIITFAVHQSQGYLMWLGFSWLAWD